MPEASKSTGKNNVLRQHAGCMQSVLVRLLTNHQTVDVGRSARECCVMLAGGSGNGLLFFTPSTESVEFSSHTPTLYSKASSGSAHALSRGHWDRTHFPAVHNACTYLGRSTHALHPTICVKPSAHVAIPLNLYRLISKTLPHFGRASCAVSCQFPFSGEPSSYLNARVVLTATSTSAQRLGHG